MTQADPVPAMTFFKTVRPPAGADSVRLELGPLSLGLTGLDAALAGSLLARYAPYASRGSCRATTLGLRLGLEAGDYFLQPQQRTEQARVLVRPDGDGRRVRYVSYRVAGWFDTAPGRGQVLLAGGDFEPADRALENFIRACIAWQAASRGGALVHAASAVLDGRGYLFYGESGAGKSTLSAHNRRGRIVSDDLSLILPDAQGRLQLVGSPFRGTYTGGPPVQGSFPLAAGFRIVKDTRDAVEPVNRLRALSEVVGNLPFVAESYALRPDLFARVEAALTAIPLAHLHFRKADTFWDAIADSGL